MTLHAASALSRRDRMWPAVGASVLAHAFVIVWALSRQTPAPIDQGQKAIVAKLVRLGEKRPEEWLPRKEAPPPPAAPPAPAAIHVPVPAAPAPHAPAAPSPHAKPPPPAAPAPPSNGKTGGTSLASIMSKVKRDVEERRFGDPNGDPAGESESGSEGDRYLGLIVQELQRNYVIPKTIGQADLVSLRATVVLRIDSTGRISGHVFEHRSGNPSYDSALERAIAQSHLPQPPPSLRDRFGREGLGVNFHL